MPQAIQQEWRNLRESEGLGVGLLQTGMANVAAFAWCGEYPSAGGLANANVAGFEDAAHSLCHRQCTASSISFAVAHRQRTIAAIDEADVFPPEPVEFIRAQACVVQGGGDIGQQWTRTKQISSEFSVTNHANPERGSYPKSVRGVEKL